jgi:hypothetical protein
MDRFARRPLMFERVVVCSPGLELYCNRSPRKRGRPVIARLARRQMLVESPGNSMPMILSATSFCCIKRLSTPTSLTAVPGGAGGCGDGGRELRERFGNDCIRIHQV